MAEGGVKGFAVELGAMLVAFAPVIAVGAAAVGWLALFSRSVSAGVDTDAMVSSLGLTTKEIEKLKNTSVSTGDVVTATFQVVADRLGINFSDIRTDRKSTRLNSSH